MDIEALLAARTDTERVERLYQMFDEDSRLSCSPSARVEFLTTMRYIEKYLTPDCRILDVGAGTGAYSLALAGQGYAVTAVELAEANLEVFRRKLRPGLDIALHQGNALDLSAFADGSFDLVLVLGPLYHLRQPADRARCVAEALRVCKPGGVLLFAFLGNDMVILTELVRDPAYLLSGDYDHESFRLEDFPFVFTTPDKARALLESGGVQLLHQVAADGMAELLAPTIDALDEESYRQYLRYHFYTCEKPELFGHSNHLLFVGRK